MSRRPPLPPSIPPASAPKARRPARGPLPRADVALVEPEEPVVVHSRVSDGLSDRLAERRRARRRLRLRAIALGAAAALLLAGAGYVLLASSLLALRVEAVEVVGANDIAPAEEVLAVVEPLDGVPLVRLDTPGLRDDLMGITGVAEATVQRDFPHGLVVTIVPREPVATVEDDGQYVLLDAEGVELDRTAEPREGVPEIDIPVSSDATADALAAVLAVMEALPADLLTQVSEVSAPSAYEVEFGLDSGARVVWGSAEDSELKAAVLERLLQVPASVYDVSAPLSPITR